MSKESETHAWLQGSVLAPLKPGPLPIIPKALWAQIEEWILSWKHAAALVKAGLQAPGALLLHGPTGTGKTSLARAILKYMPGRPGAIMECHGVLTQMFGESPRNVAKGFALAGENNALLVVEEIDGLGISRDHAKNDPENEKITIALMRSLEMATMPVIATTNFHSGLDAALLRRFELQLEVPALDEQGRALVLRKILGREASAELIAMPLVESIRLAHRQRRREFLDEQEARSKDS